jgi:hypothetical protein
MEKIRGLQGAFVEAEPVMVLVSNAFVEAEPVMVLVSSALSLGKKGEKNQAWELTLVCSNQCWPPWAFGPVRVDDGIAEAPVRRN